MSQAIFLRQDGKFIPTTQAEGVWAKGLLQGSAVTAQTEREVNTISSSEGRDICRLTFELWRPA